MYIYIYINYIQRLQSIQVEMMLRGFLTLSNRICWYHGLMDFEDGSLSVKKNI